MNLKLIAAAAGGVAWGGTMVWAVMADKYDRIIAQQNMYIEYLRYKRHEAETEVDYLRANQAPSAEEMLEAVRDGMTAADEASIQLGTIEEQEEQEEAEREYTDEEIAEARANLQGIIDQYAAEPQIVEQFVERVIDRGFEAKQPYVISRESYAHDDDYEEHEKLTLTYLPRFRVLLDEDNEVVDDPGAVVGWKNLTRFGDESGDVDTVFIRNERMEADFEVVRDEDAELPLHVKYGMGREEFATARAAGRLRLRDEDRE